MRKSWLSCSLVAVLLSCSGVGDFDVTRETDEVVVEGMTSPLETLLPVKVLPDMDLEFDLQSELAAQDADGAHAVRLSGLEMNITETLVGEGDEDDFDFLENIEFFVESAKADSDLPRVRVANIDEVPSGVESIQLDTDESVDLKPYAEEGILLTTSGEGTVPPDDVSIKGTVTVTQFGAATVTRYWHAPRP